MAEKPIQATAYPPNGYYSSPQTAPYPNYQQYPVLPAPSPPHQSYQPYEMRIMPIPVPVQPMSYIGPLVGDMPILILKPHESLYINVHYNHLGCKKVYAELFIGTRLSKGPLIATAEMPYPCCNYCFKCGCSCFCFTPIPIRNPDGIVVGEFNLGKGCSRVCCCPRMDITFNKKPIGKIQTVCCLFCNTCIKDIEGPKGTEYRSSKCIFDKVMWCFDYCFEGIYAMFRICCDNVIEEEVYDKYGQAEQTEEQKKDNSTVSAVLNKGFPEFMIVNEVKCCTFWTCGCRKHFEVILGPNFSGEIMPEVYLKLFAAGVIQAFQHCV